MPKQTYVSQNAPSLKIKLRLDGPKEPGTVFQFENGVLHLDEEVAAVFDKQIAENPAVSQFVRKIDREAALRQAEAHKAQMLSEVGATKGVDSGKLHAARMAGMEARDADLASQGDLAKLKAEMDQENLVLTDKGETPAEENPPQAEQAQQDGNPTEFANEMQKAFATLGDKPKK